MPMWLVTVCSWVRNRGRGGNRAGHRSCFTGVMATLLNSHGGKLPERREITRQGVDATTIQKECGATSETELTGESNVFSDTPPHVRVVPIFEKPLRIQPRFFGECCDLCCRPGVCPTWSTFDEG